MLNLYFKDKDGNVTDKSKPRSKSFSYDDFEEGSWEGVGFGDDSSWGSWGEEEDKEMDYEMAEMLLTMFSAKGKSFFRSTIFNFFF